jgi:hypothetical protein
MKGLIEAETGAQGVEIQGKGEVVQADVQMDVQTDAQTDEQTHIHV